MTAKILIQVEKREVMEETGREKVVIPKKEYYVPDDSRDFQTTYGSIVSEDLQKPSGTKVESSKGAEYIVIEPTFHDLHKRLKKMPQTPLLKDIGQIIVETGIGKDSLVVDAGAGSGSLSGFLAHIVKKVVAYEKREDFLKNVQSNFDKMGLDNIELKHKDVSEGIEETEVDLVTFDMPEPWTGVKTAGDALKVGGFLIGYVPTIPQVMKFVEVVKEDGRFEVVKTSETIERPWVVDGKRVRPGNMEVGHSGFITIVRKVQA
jgi:tRNA (adenine57-N1/adenine58-N1)-methyltransferase